MIGLPYGEKTMTFLSDTGTLRTDRQTDGQTDRQICYINMLTRDKNLGTGV